MNTAENLKLRFFGGLITTSTTFVVIYLYISHLQSGNKGGGSGIILPLPPLLCVFETSSLVFLAIANRILAFRRRRNDVPEALERRSKAIGTM